MRAQRRVQVGVLARQPARLGKLASAGTRSATNLSGMLQRTTAAVKARPRRPTRSPGKVAHASCLAAGGRCESGGGLVRGLVAEPVPVISAKPRFIPAYARVWPCSWQVRCAQWRPCARTGCRVTECFCGFAAEAAAGPQLGRGAGRTAGACDDAAAAFFFFHARLAVRARVPLPKGDQRRGGGGGQRHSGRFRARQWSPGADRAVGRGV